LPGEGKKQVRKKKKAAGGRRLRIREEIVGSSVQEGGSSLDEGGKRTATGE